MVEGDKKKSIGCGGLILAAIVIYFLFQFGGGFLGLLFGGLNDSVTTPSPPTNTVISEPALPQPKDIPRTIVDPNAGGTIEPPKDVQPLQFSEAFSSTSQSDKLIERNFTWNYLGEWNWDIGIPESLYNYYHGLPRLPTIDYSVYVTHPLDDPYIGKFVETIRQAAAAKGLTEWQTIELTMAFVQNLPYKVDSVTTPFDEYPRYPIETIVDGGGDCEDTSILLAALLDEMGYGVVLISPPSHMAVGLKCADNTYGTSWSYKGAKYYYIESTGFGSRIGEVPKEYANSSASIYPLVPKPIITHDWTPTGEGFYLKLQIIVKNLGTAPANNMYVYAAFDAGNDMVWNSEKSEVFNLKPGEQVTAILYLRPPTTGTRTRIIVHVTMDGYSVDESYSKWYDY